MVKMIFPTLWRKWIIECVTTTSASLLVNGSPTNKFNFERILPQGDPLSPFLFLIAPKGINVLVKKTMETGLFTGYYLSRLDNISISHLQFVDDILFLGVKSWINVRSLKVVLILFEAISSLKVNFNKSMLVGVNVATYWLAEAAFVLNCKMGHIPFLYVRLPIDSDSLKPNF